MLQKAFHYSLLYLNGIRNIIPMKVYELTFKMHLVIHHFQRKKTFQVICSIWIFLIFIKVLHHFSKNIDELLSTYRYC